MAWPSIGDCSTAFEPIGFRTPDHLVCSRGFFLAFQIVKNVGMKISVGVVFAMMSFLDDRYHKTSSTG